MKRRLLLLLVLALGLLPVAWPGATREAAAQAALAPSATVVIQFGGALGNVYSPSEVVINVDDTVEWQGEFSFHPLVSDDGLWTTPDTGTTFQHTFDTPGIFRFHCRNHGGFGGVGMSGRVIVRAGPESVYLPMLERD